MPTVIIGQSGQGNVVGNVRNTAGGLAVQNSGLINNIAAYYPSIGASIPPTVVVWESGGIIQAMRTNDGVIIASGDSVFAQVMKGAIEAAAPINGTILIKAGSYSLESGIVVSGDVRIMGEGVGTSIQMSDLGATSGLFRLGGTAGFQELSDMDLQCVSGTMIGVFVNSSPAFVRIKNLEIQVNSIASGSKGILLNNSDNIQITEIREIRNWEHGIHLNGTGCVDNYIDGIPLINCNNGIVLTGARRNTIDNVTHTSVGTVGTVVLESGASRNAISNIMGRSTSVPTVLIRTSAHSNTLTNIGNTSGGPAIANSGGGINDVGATYDKIGIADSTRFTIWESGGVMTAMRNADGVIIASGTNAADLFNTVMRAGPFDRTILVKTGDYTFTSGINIGGGTKLIGEEGHPGSPNPFLNFDASSGMISGAIIASGVRIVMQNLSIFCDSGVRNGIVVRDSGPTISKVTVEGNSLSGTHGIRLTGGNGTDLYDVGAFLFDVGIFMGSGAGIFPEPKWYSLNNVSVSNNNTGILMDGAHQATFTDIFGDDSNVSGTIRLVGGASQNIIDGVKAANISGSVVILVSGVNNRITNITNASGGPCIVDLTSGSRNFVLPGQLQPVELISGTSPYTYTNASGRQELITVGGGTVSLIEFVRAGTTTALSGLTAGTFILNGGDKLTVTYSAAPAIKVIPTG